MALIWYMTQSLALSSSTQNSEKLNQAGFKFPPPPGVIIPVYLQFNGEVFKKIGLRPRLYGTGFM